MRWIRLTVLVLLILTTATRGYSSQKEKNEQKPNKTTVVDPRPSLPAGPLAIVPDEEFYRFGSGFFGGASFLAESDLFELARQILESQLVARGVSLALSSQGLGPIYRELELNPERARLAPVKQLCLVSVGVKAVKNKNNLFETLFYGQARQSRMIIIGLQLRFVEVANRSVLGLGYGQAPARVETDRAERFFISLPPIKTGSRTIKRGRGIKIEIPRYLRLSPIELENRSRQFNDGSQALEQAINQALGQFQYQPSSAVTDGSAGNGKTHDGFPLTTDEWKLSIARARNWTPEYLEGLYWAIYEIPIDHLIEGQSRAFWIDQTGQQRHGLIVGIDKIGRRILYEMNYTLGVHKPRVNQTIYINDNDDG